MKRLLVLLTSLAGMLILAGVWMLFTKKDNGQGKMFQVKGKQLEHISGIVFREDTVRLVLKREEKGWRVDGLWPVRPRSIKVLKEVLSHMKVKSPVSEEMVQQMLADTGSRHVKVLVYKGMFPIKRIEVCVNTRIPGGNMMRLSHKKKWYIVYLPAEEVNPAVFFLMDPYYWRDRTLFRYLPGEVLQVEMVYGKKSKDGYQVGLDTLSKRYYLFPKDTSWHVYKVDTTRIKTYLTYFQHLACDAYDRSLSREARDSILRTKPLYILSVKDMRGKRFRMQIYPLPNKNHKPGAPVYDPDVARAWVSPLDKMVLIRYYRMDPLLQETRWFLAQDSE